MAGSRSLGVLTVDLVAKTGAFTQGLDKAGREFQSKLSKMEKQAYAFGNAIGKGLRFAAGAAAAGVTALTALTIQSINYADQLDEMSQKLGVSTEQLSKWAYAANLSGTDIDTVARSVNLLSKNLAAAADPTSKMGELFAALGVQVKDAAGNLRSADDVLPELADRFKALDNQTTETALAMQLFGKSGAELLEFLNRGSDGINALGDELDTLGGVISTDTAAAAAQFKDELDKLKIAGQGLGLEIAARLLPSLTDSAVKLRELVKDGDLAANMVTVLSTAMKSGVFILDQYNNAVARASIAIEGFVNLQRGVAEIAANVGPAGLFNEGSVLDGIKRITRGYEDAQAQLDRLVESQNKAASGRTGPSALDIDNQAIAAARQAVKDAAAAEKAAAQLKAIQGALAGGGGGKGGGKSEANKEAERLQQSYESLMESMRERIALFGQEGEAARVRYDTEFGALAKLDDARKEELISLAEQYDVMVDANKLREEEIKLMDEENERIRRGLEDGGRLLDDLRFELELMKMTNAERDTAIQLRGLEAEAVKAYGEQIAAANQQIYDSMQQIEIMDTFRDSFANFFEDVIGGTKSVSDAFKDMLDDINQQILRRITENWVEQLFGAMGTSQSGSAGGGWMSWFAGLFGGGKAGGGWAAANTMYEVNERGFEMASVGGKDYMLTGNKPVHITPNHRLDTGGRGDTIVQFNGYGRPDRRTAQQAAADVAVAAQRSLSRNGRGGRG